MKNWLSNLDRIIIYFIIAGLFTVLFAYSYFDSFHHIAQNKSLIIEFCLKTVAVINSIHLIIVLPKIIGKIKEDETKLILLKYKAELQFLLFGTALAFIFDIVNIISTVTK